MSTRRRDLVVAAVLALVSVVVVGVSAQDLGFTRDEGYYFKAGELYWGWFRELASSPSTALSADGIDRHWSYNHEHPALLKTLFAFGYGLRELTGLPRDTHDALRFPAWCVAGFSVALVFLLARSLALSMRAALAASAMWIAMPHVFWHMHVACFDVGVAAAHTALVLVYLKWRHTVRGAVAVGAVFGLAAAVKHNVVPVPALFVLHWIVMELRWPASPSASRDGYVLPRIPLVFFALALVGPLVFLLHWPWLWHAPSRVGAWLGYHMNHEHYPILWFGELLTAPPFPVSFPFVMSAVTIPAPTLAAMLVGFALGVAVVVRFLLHRARRVRGDVELTMVPLGDVTRAPSASPALLLLLNAFMPFFLIALPSTPIFGGTKHWMNALPFLCVLAAWGIEEGIARIRGTFAGSSSSFAAAGVVVAFLALMIAPGIVISARVWPYGLGSYNEIIGFARGAANVGMQRTFWGYEPRAALDEINRRTPRGGRIHFGDTNQDSTRMYKRDGLLRSDINYLGTVRGSAVASVQPQGEFKQQWMDVWNEWDDRSPDVVLHAEGVPVCTVTFAP